LKLTDDEIRRVMLHYSLRMYTLTLCVVWNPCFLTLPQRYKDLEKDWDCDNGLSQVELSTFDAFI
jgi:hypothetical protein